MNEQIIQDLVIKARELAVSATPDNGKCFDLDVFHNKFAELIVRKCIKLCDQVDIVGADECIDNVRNYFGV